MASVPPPLPEQSKLGPSQDTPKRPLYEGILVKVLLPALFGSGSIITKVPKDATIGWLKDKIATKIGSNKETAEKFELFLAADQKYEKKKVIFGLGSTGAGTLVPLADELHISLFLDTLAEGKSYLAFQLKIPKPKDTPKKNKRTNPGKDEAWASADYISSVQDSQTSTKGYEPSLALYVEEMEMEGSITPFLSFASSDGTYHFADGSILLSDGKEVMMPDGSKSPVRPPSEGALWKGEDGSSLLSTGAMEYPSGSVTTSRGMITLASGEEMEPLWPLLPYGTMLLPTGTLVLPNGALKYADGCCMLGMQLQLNDEHGKQFVSLREEEGGDDSEGERRFIDGTTELGNGIIRLPSGCVTVRKHRNKLLHPKGHLVDTVFQLPEEIGDGIDEITMPKCKWNKQAYLLYVMELHRAAQQANLPKVLSCLKAGCNPNNKDDLDNTPLHLTPCIETALALVRYGARLDLLNSKGRTAVCFFVYSDKKKLCEVALEYLQRSPNRWEDEKEYVAFINALLGGDQAFPKTTNSVRVESDKSLMQKPMHNNPSPRNFRSSIMSTTMLSLQPSSPTQQTLSLSISCQNLVSVKPKKNPVSNAIIGVYISKGAKHVSSRLIGQTEWIMHNANPSFDRKVLINANDINFLKTHENSELRFAVHDCNKTKKLTTANLIGESVVQFRSMSTLMDLDFEEEIDDDIDIYGSDEERDSLSESLSKTSLNQTTATRPEVQGLWSDNLKHPTDVKLQQRIEDANTLIFVHGSMITDSDTLNPSDSQKSEVNNSRLGSTWINLSFQCENLPETGELLPGYKIAVFSRRVDEKKYQFLGHTEWIENNSHPSFQHQVRLLHNIEQPMDLKVSVYAHPYKAEKDYLLGEAKVSLQLLLSQAGFQETLRLRNKQDSYKHKLLRNQAATVSVKFHSSPCALLKDDDVTNPLEMALEVSILRVPNPHPFQGIPIGAVYRKNQVSGRYDIMTLVSRSDPDARWSSPQTFISLPSKMLLSELDPDTELRVDLHDAKDSSELCESEQVGSACFNLREMLVSQKLKELTSSKPKNCALLVDAVPIFFGEIEVTMNCRHLVKPGTFGNLNPVAVVFDNHGTVIAQTEIQKNTSHPSFLRTVCIVANKATDWQVTVSIFNTDDKARKKITMKMGSKNKIGSAIIDFGQLARQSNSSLFFSYPLSSSSRPMNKRLQEKGSELCISVALVGLPWQKGLKTGEQEPMQGFLMMRVESLGTKIWAKRWCQLHAGILTYWKEKDVSQNPVGQLHVWGAHVCTYTNSMKGMKQGVFSVKICGNSRIYYFQTAELAERAHWCKALQYHGALMRQLVNNSLVASHNRSGTSLTMPTREPSENLPQKNKGSRDPNKRKSTAVWVQNENVYDFQDD